MPYLLLGSNSFAKNNFIYDLAKKTGGDLVIFKDADNLPKFSDLNQADLFSKPKVFWFDGLLPEFLGEVKAGTGNRIIVTIDSLDKRKKETKDLLNNPLIEVKEFSLPHGSELNLWLKDRVQFYNGKIASDAIEALAVRLGRDDAKETKFGGKVINVEEIYNLWQADSEVKKLVDYSDGQEITASNVKDLVVENGEVDVFELTNAIADNQKQKTWELLQAFLKQQGGTDEKTAIIQLNALLCEQFRNVAMVQSFSQSKIGEDKILEATGWKSGRLFVIKKIASRFPPVKVLEALNKFKALDEELKSTSTPPKVLLDLIISQLL